jgi:electron transport complex protein RnfE
MGIFIPLIVVNCIPLGRAEAFCYKKGVLPSFADGLGMGLGYTISLTVLAIIREVLGNGTFFNHPISFLGPTFQPYAFMITAPGAFVCLGLMLCIMNLLGKK